MKKLYSNAVSLFVLSALVVGCAVAPATTASFKQDISIEEVDAKGNYLLKNDDSKVYGKKIKSLYGLAVKDYVSIDGQKFKPSEIKGYRDGKFYYGRFNDTYIKRVVHGPINVYVRHDSRMNTSGATGITRTSVSTYEYYQKGENGEMILFGDRDIKQIVKGCAKAEAMADKSASELRKAIKKNPSYLNEIFEVYNKDCKPS